MRIRSSHVVGIVFLAIVVFVLAIAFVDRGAEPGGPGGAAAVAQTPPKLRLEHETLDMGVISNTETTSMPVTLQNTGGQALEILSASGSCPCTWAEVDEKRIPPRGSTTLRVTMDPFQISGFESSKTVSIRSNDPARRVTVLKVVAKIEPEFHIDPLTLNLGQHRKGEEAAVSMVLRQAREERVEVTNLRHASREPEGVELTYALRPEATWQTPGKAEWEITARLKPDIPVGRIVHYFDIITNVERLKSGLRSAVTGEVITFYKVTPAGVLPLQAVTPGQADVAVVTVSSPVPITIANPAFTTDGLAASVRSEDEGRRSIIDVSVLPEATPGRLDGRLSFDVTGEGQTVTESLRVMGVVRAPQPAPAS